MAQAVFTHGPAPEIDNLPAYRTPERMRVWLAQPLPLGKECLLELDAATDPLYEPQHLIVMPGGGEALHRMLEGEIALDDGLRALQHAIAAHRAEVPLTIRD